MNKQLNPNPVYELGDCEYKVGKITRKIAITVTSTVVTKEDEEEAKRNLETVYRMILKQMRCI